MAIDSVEILESQRISRHNGAITGEREFMVWDTTNASLSPVDAVTASNIPVLLDPFPNFPSIKRLDIDPRRVPGASNMVSVLVGYAQIPPSNPFGSTQLQPEEIGHISVNIKRKGELIEVWRTNPTFAPMNGVLDAAGMKTDIGGTPVDIEGEPISMPFIQQIMTVTEVLETTPLSDAYANALNKRNSAVFAGAGVGHVLYIGSDSDQIRHGAWQQTHVFVWDEFFHMRQVPRRANKNVALIAPDALDVKHKVAKDVYWRQVFPNLTDFNGLSLYF